MGFADDRDATDAKARLTIYIQDLLVLFEQEHESSVNASHATGQEWWVRLALREVKVKGMGCGTWDAEEKFLDSAFSLHFAADYVQHQ